MFFLISLLLTLLVGILVWRVSFPVIEKMYIFLSSRKFTEEHQMTKIRRMFFAAPGSSNQSGEEKLRRLYLAIGAALLGFLITGTIFFAVLLGALGFYAPVIYVRIKENRRLQAIDRQLADGLVLVTNSLRSGLSFAQGLEVLSEQGQSPLKEEFKVVTDELKLGVPMEKALNNLSDRLKGSKEMRIAVTAINIARETGGNLSEALETIATTMRKRNEMAGKISAMTSQGRLSGIIVTLLPVALGFVINMIDPLLMRPLYTTIPGYFVLMVMFFLIAVGWVLIKKIIEIDI